jgi:hypothetical protein
MKLTKHPDDILILFISQGLITIAIIDGGFNYLYSLFTAITALFLPQPPPLLPPARKRRSTRRPKRDKKPAAIEDPGEENTLSLSMILPATTPSPPPLATAPATPSLIVSETILGILFSFSSSYRIHNYLTSRSRYEQCSRLRRYLSRPTRRRQTISTRFNIPGHSRSIHPRKIRRPPQRRQVLLS